MRTGRQRPVFSTTTSGTQSPRRRSKAAATTSSSTCPGVTIPVASAKFSCSCREVRRCPRASSVRQRRTTASAARPTRGRRTRPRSGAAQVHLCSLACSRPWGCRPLRAHDDFRGRQRHRHRDRTLRRRNHGYQRLLGSMFLVTGRLSDIHPAMPGMPPSELVFAYTDIPHPLMPLPRLELTLVSPSALRARRWWRSGLPPVRRRRRRSR